MARDQLQEKCNRCVGGVYHLPGNGSPVTCRYCGGSGVVDASMIVLRVLRSRKSAYNTASGNDTLYAWAIRTLDRAADYAEPTDRKLDADGRLILSERNKSDPLQGIAD